VARSPHHSLKKCKKISAIIENTLEFGKIAIFVGAQRLP